ncbi:MAG TPA: hypothetical protein VG652_10325 [Gaiellaceae bacterium]|nr:hypothetical protein [Gaiellaceae bacterium]
MAAGVAGCGGHHAATTTTTTTASKRPALLTARRVARVFAGVGLKLHDPSPSGSSPHLYATVTMLTTVRPHQGWNVATYIYPTSEQATASFSEDAGEWSASGIQSVQVRNVVVVVVPLGHLLTKRAHFFPMPKVVYKALHLLSQPR